MKNSHLKVCIFNSHAQTVESSRLTIPETEFQIIITEKQNLRFSFAFNSIVFCISTYVLAFIMPPGKLCKASEKIGNLEELQQRK